MKFVQPSKRPQRTFANLLSPNTLATSTSRGLSAFSPSTKTQPQPQRTANPLLSGGTLQPTTSALPTLRK